MYPNNADRHILQMGTVIWGADIKGSSSALGSALSNRGAAPNLQRVSLL